MAVVASLPKNLDGDLNIKVDLTFTALLTFRAGEQRCYNTIALVTCTLREQALNYVLYCY